MDDLNIIWIYEPADYLEEPFRYPWKEFEILIDSGEAKIMIPGTEYDSNRGIVDEIYNEIEGLFLGARVVNGKPFILRKASRTMKREKPDGGSDIYFSGSASAISVTETVDLVIRDSEGNVVGDMRAERIKEREEFAKLASLYGMKDPTARAILGSYGQAVADQENELVHLYEITESLQKRYQSEKNAITALEGVSRNHWERLRLLANSDLKQGRNRGEYPGQLRAATSAELDEARKIAKSMIWAYLKNLEKHSEK